MNRDELIQRTAIALFTYGLRDPVVAGHESAAAAISWEYAKALADAQPGRKDARGTCRDCWHWQFRYNTTPTDVGSGQCRKRAPESKDGGDWPEELGDSWCGDFEPSNAQPEEIQGD